MLQLDEGLP